MARGLHTTLTAGGGVDVFYRWLSILVLLLAGCQASGNSAGQPFTYAFRDGGRYRVDCSYQLEKRLTKAFGRRQFSDHGDGLYTKFSFGLRTTSTPSGEILAAYTLLRFRIHDAAGHFLLEAGREGGNLSWFGGAQSLEAYLGPEGVRDYYRLLAQPLAMVRIDRRGIQPGSQGRSQGPKFEFNYALLRLLGKNRVIGEYIMQSVKIPPVLMLIFDRRPIRPGQGWNYSSQANSEFVTHFSLKSQTPYRAVITCWQRTNLKQENFQTLGRMLGLEPTQAWTLTRGDLQLDGEVDFLSAAGRPQAGWMEFAKHYLVGVKDETWTLTARERYDFTVAPEP